MRGDSMLDFFNFRKKRKQEQELKDKLFKESMSAINKVQTMAIVAQTILKIHEDNLIAKAKIAKLRNEEQLFKTSEGR
jgi:hypothetical protein